MDTINTVIANAQSLSSVPVNWSLDAGPIWLVMMMVGVVTIAVMAGVSEARQKRQEARQALYRKAHAEANIRLNRLERQGFQETV
jgi:hypothetical protein